MKRTYVIYCHTLKSDGRKYIGITSQLPRKRWSYGGGYEKRTHIGAAIRKYGWDAFEHEILETDLTQDEAQRKEREYIELYQTNDRSKGFNLTAGGEGVLGLKMSEEVIEKLRKSHTGKKLSDETRKRMSESRLEYYRTHPHPEANMALIKRMAEINRGRVGWNKGKKLSEATKQKIREANIGRKASEETRNKMRECVSRKKKVVAYSLNGTLFKVFNSIADAARYFGVKKGSHITECCKGSRGQYLNYKWSYYGE